MDGDPTLRFSSRAAAYELYRPSYPAEVRKLAERECGLCPGARVADIGCGPGFLARLFVDAGYEVFGIEPNPEMRRAGEEALGALPRFHSLAGRAEATGLPDGAVELVTAGQAFHWFEPQAAKREFRRILRPGGWTLLVWNERRPAPGFMQDYERLIAECTPEKRRISLPAIGEFFGAAGFREACFENRQVLDAAGLRGRVASSSYAPPQDTPRFAALMDRLDGLFARYQQQGKVTILYDTLVYYGPLR